MVFAQSLRFRQHDLELEPAVALNRPTLSLLKHFLDGLVGGSSAAVLQWPAGQRDVSTLHPLAMLAMIGSSPAHQVGTLRSCDAVPDFRTQLGRASCRERVCQYVYISVVAVE